MAKRLHAAKENGSNDGELDDETRAKAERTVLRLYEINPEPTPDAPGDADFN